MATYMTVISHRAQLIDGTGLANSDWGTCIRWTIVKICPVYLSHN